MNHNLNTSEIYYGEICTTHTFADRLATLRAVRDAGMEMCSGGIIGMGEQRQDVVDMAITLRDLGVQSIPVNFFNPIDGTPLAGRSDLNPRYCLKVLAMFRLVNPDREIRIAGGRELHLGSLQALALYAANSIFVGDYLTTKGQAPEADYQMIRDLGFEVVRNPRNAALLTEAESLDEQCNAAFFADLTHHLTGILFGIGKLLPTASADIRPTVGQTIHCRSAPTPPSDSTPRPLFCSQGCDHDASLVRDRPGFRHRC